ncbi:hypothetical protein Ga0074812_109118 [Parafrankia irregularis]|uniref:Effector-associated domain-containing protein n=1 Tax=Parafrankia irregularis TaxID=795642 RepID=A0A0S4QPF4_9ACTN|nr:MULTISPECIES: effector-associated domain EAD1-containing protein [Parafrankia]MBE3200566.1 hypothetical protein [Parafrankia sp. CH37]CUU56898.1 hypothetical protein Ga0074812_109118 [Parafrankia irregularis]
MDEHLTDDEIEALAETFGDPLSARHVLVAAGLAAARQPSWGNATPLRYWREVSVLLGAGIIAEGRHRVLAAAADVFPGNPAFAPPAAAAPASPRISAGQARPSHPDSATRAGSTTYYTTVTDSTVVVGSHNRVRMKVRSAPGGPAPGGPADLESRTRSRFTRVAALLWPRRPRSAQDTR